MQQLTTATFKELTMGGFDFQSLIEIAKALMPMITQIVSMFR